MNVYDFDGTLYRGDSSTDFYFYALRRKPSLLRYLPGQIAATVLYALKKIDKTEMKQRLFRFFGAIDAAAMTADFWDTHRRKLFAWYPERRKADDVVISASPAFLLSPICKQLGVSALMASPVEPKTGVYSGKNCSGEEKVRRYRKAFGDAVIDEFYSDSRRDLPMAKLANKAYLVRRGKPIPWKR
ncbi:MAG: HAD-IB family phosphatase [Oscillospiraceae bacterium]|nr:HAD-IB family phosphatase [Oscillospiraceae bacterium]